MNVDQVVYGYVAKEEVYPNKAAILEEGSGGEWVYVILEGLAKVQKRTASGIVTLDTLKEGDIFGEMSLLAEGQGVRSAMIAAVDGPVRVGILDTERLIGDYESISPHLKSMLKTLVLRLKETTDKVCATVVELNQEKPFSS
jgi:CRP-like cAMP-binding protein